MEILSKVTLYRLFVTSYFDTMYYNIGAKIDLNCKVFALCLNPSRLLLSAFVGMQSVIRKFIFVTTNSSVPRINSSGSKLCKCLLAKKRENVTAINKQKKRKEKMCKSREVKTVHGIMCWGQVMWNWILSEATPRDPPDRG